MTLPEMSVKIHEWMAQRKQLNHTYSQIQEIFRSTIIAYHPGIVNYPKQLSELPANNQLDDHSVKVKGFIEEKNSLKESIDKLINDIDDSNQKLHDWLSSADAELLWKWPN